MKRALIVLLALLTLTACTKDTAEIAETSAEETFTEQTTQTVQTTSATEATAETTAVTENKPVEDILDYPALGQFLYDIAQQNFGVYIFDYNSDGANDALAYCTAENGLSYYLINDIDNPTMALDFSSSREAYVLYDNANKQYLIYAYTYNFGNSESTHEEKIFSLGDEISKTSYITKYNYGIEEEVETEYSINANGEVQSCTKEELYDKTNELNDLYFAALNDLSPKYTFCRMSVNNGEILFNVIKDVEPQLPSKIVFSTYTFGKEYPSLCGKQLTFTMKNPEYSDEGYYVGTIEIAVDGVVSYSTNMKLNADFDVNVCDYNGDDNPEFAFNDNPMLKNDCYILTVSENGTVSECDINNGKSVSKTIYLQNKYDVSPLLTKSGDKSICSTYFTTGGISEDEMLLLTSADIDEWLEAHPDKAMSEFYLKNTYTWDGNAFVISNQQIIDDKEQFENTYKQVSEGNEFIDFELIDNYKGITDPDKVKPQLKSAMTALKNSIYYAYSIMNYNTVSNKNKIIYYESDGTPIPQFSEAFVNDYDGDGNDEAFVIINIALHENCVGSILIFVDSNGNAKVLEAFHSGYSVQLLDYGKNKQLIIGTGGCMGASSITEIFGMRNGSAYALCDLRGDFVKENCFLSGFGWQASGDFMYFDTVALEYRIISGEEVSMDDIIAMDKDGVLSDYYPDDENIYSFPTFIGGKYYCLRYGLMDSGTIYTYENGKFVLQENSNVRYSTQENNTVIDIDIDKALAEMKKP